MNRCETKLSGLIFHEDVLIDNANEAVGKVWWDFPDSLAYTKNSDTKRFVTLLRSYSAGVSGCCCAASGCAVPKFGPTALGSTITASFTCCCISDCCCCIVDSP